MRLVARAILSENAVSMHLENSLLCHFNGRIKKEIGDSENPLQSDRITSRINVKPAQRCHQSVTSVA